jgi:hypothetical protein
MLYHSYFAKMLAVFPPAALKSIGVARYASFLRLAADNNLAF